MGAPRVLGAGVTREERPKNKKIKNKRPTNKPKRKKKEKKKSNKKKKKKKKHKQTNKQKRNKQKKQTKKQKTNKKFLTKPNKPNTSLEPDLNVLTLTAMTPNKHPARGRAASVGRTLCDPWL